MNRKSRARTILVVSAVWVVTIGCIEAPPVEDRRVLGAGFRYSAYGPDHNPGPSYWSRVGHEMAARFEGSVPETIWIVSSLDGDGTRLHFPVAEPQPLISGSETDANEAALDLFDEQGFRVWLQVEPGHAPIEDLIHLVLGRYGHHPSVIGFGIDVEWYQSTTRPEGKAVTDAEAEAWLAAVRSHDPDYRLFLKHWETGKMPPTVRDGLLFVDDSQILPSREAMVAEFAEWGRAFAPAPVAFQYGYPSDRPWWRRLDDPPGDIGRAILDAVPNVEGLYWVDFTVLDVFPPGGATPVGGTTASLSDVYYDPVSRPIVGVKIYEHNGDLEELFASWQDLGFSAAFVSEELASRDQFRDLAERSGTDLFVVFPVLQAPEDLTADPELYAVTATGEVARDDWVEFACPSRDEFRQRRVEEAVDLVRRLRPDGLSLDFIRHFVYWEMVGPDDDPAGLPDTCYCPVCLERFTQSLESAAATNLPVDDPPAAAAWIRANAADEWVRFKTETITSLAWEIMMAVRAVKTSIRINLHTVPWRTDDFGGAITRIAGQDRAALGGLADSLSPMCYSFMLHRAPKWISSVVADAAEVGNCPVLPSIQVAEHYRSDSSFDVKEFEACVRAALEPPSAGVVFWKWDHIAADPARADAIRKVIREVHRPSVPDSG
jgi:hypothetical protein